MNSTMMSKARRKYSVRRRRLTVCRQLPSKQYCYFQPAEQIPCQPPNFPRTSIIYIRNPHLCQPSHLMSVFSYHPITNDQRSYSEIVDVTDSITMSRISSLVFVGWPAHDQLTPILEDLRWIISICQALNRMLLNVRKTHLTYQPPCTSCDTPREKGEGT